MTHHDGLAALSLAELLERSRALVGELASRVSDPGLPESMARFPADPEAGHVDRSAQWGLYAHADAPEDGVNATPDEESARHDVADNDVPEEPWVPAGSLPVVQLGVEELGRLVDAARTALAGQVDRVFGDHATRRVLLGIPEGKCVYRNATEYLRGHLRIPRAEAKKRLRRAGLVMARRGFDGTGDEPPILPVLAEAIGWAQLDVSAADLVADTLSSARRGAALAGVATKDVVDGLVADGERSLVATAQDTDPDTLRKVCAYWRQRFDAVADPDGLEPTEAQTDAVQGLFYHGRGAADLHRWSLMATDAQHEVLKTIASAASNPRTANPAGGVVEDHDARQDTTCSWAGHLAEADALDARGRARRELDGLVSALTGALTLTGRQDGPGDGLNAGAGNGPPDPGGGARPQVLVVIDYETLKGQYENGRHGTSRATGTTGPAGTGDPIGPPGTTGPAGLAGPASQAGPTGSPGPTGRLVSQAAYTGPVNPQTIRRLACEADLIPVVLGGRGEVLDVGRSQRLFTRKLRRAITARDRGCAAPSCSIPAPWCEAHHIQHWENGGPTSVDNGVLLCSHHHHAVHTGAWDIHVENGVPWFIPARYHDPDQRPRRNHNWHFGHPGHPGTPGYPGSIKGKGTSGPGVNDHSGDVDDAA